MTLREALDAFRAEWTATAPAGRAALYDAKVAELRRSGLIEQALGVGDMAPDFTLPSATGSIVTLSQRLALGPVVLTFYRGGWCPYCNIQLKAYQRRLIEITRLGGQLIAVSPQSPDSSLSTRETNALTFDVLSDLGNNVARAFGLVYALPEELRQVLRQVGKALPAINGDESWELPVPATFVITPDGRLVLSYVEVDYRMRLEPDEIIATLAELMRARAGRLRSA